MSYAVLILAEYYWEEKDKLENWAEKFYFSIQWASMRYKLQYEKGNARTRI